MPTSLPSREIYVIDIPEVKQFDATFVYNYFVSGEAVDEMAGVSSKYYSAREDLKVSTDVQRLSTRVPRWIELQFAPSKIFDSMSNVSDGIPVASTYRSKLDNRRLISENLQKIMSEEEFASYYFISMDFRDDKLMEKMHDFVEGTTVFSSLMGAGFSPEVHPQSYSSGVEGMFIKALASTPGSIDSKWLMNVIDPEKAAGVKFLNDTPEQERRMKKLLHDVSRVIPSSQVNVKYAGMLIENAIDDPFCHYDAEFMQTYKDALASQEMAREHLKSSIISLSEYKTVAPSVSKHPLRGNVASSKTSVRAIGYLIDKVEVRSDGSIISHDPIIVDNPDAAFTVDFNVRYYSEYTYMIRTLALVTMPAVMPDLDDIAMHEFIIASRPVVATANCRENVPPPPVADLNFVWDYENERLVISWSFPPNPQRDVKKFQIYRRENIDQPFQLLKMYDFDDSAVTAEQLEAVEDKLIEKMVGNPRTYYVDVDFRKSTQQDVINATGSSKYIYAVTCVDAHGIPSAYSAQFEVSFDVFKNRLIKRLISHQGAPRTYPNLYLNIDAFVDTICDGPGHDQSRNPSGPHSRLTMYFTPECYNVTINGIKRPVVMTDREGGKYKLLMINLDNQQQQLIDVYIDNKLGEKT